MHFKTASYEFSNYDHGFKTCMIERQKSAGETLAWNVDLLCDR